MTYLVEVPVEGGGRLVVEASSWQLPGDLELAALRPGDVVARTQETLEQALEGLQPALEAVTSRLRAMGPQKFGIEFGLSLGAEGGVVVAKGTTEVHFTVTMEWNTGDQEE
jgi:Trypsin-co-occurring domain 1